MATGCTDGPMCLYIGDSGRTISNMARVPRLGLMAEAMWASGFGPGRVVTACTIGLVDVCAVRGRVPGGQEACMAKECTIVRCQLLSKLEYVLFVILKCKFIYLLDISAMFYIY